MWYRISNSKLLTGVALTVWALGTLVLGVADAALMAAGFSWTSGWVPVGRAGNMMIVGAFPAVVLSAYVRATSLNRVTLAAAVVTWAGAFLAHFQVLNLGRMAPGSPEATAGGLFVVAAIHAAAVLYFVRSPD